jgi:hypothetical protein
MMRDTAATIGIAKRRSEAILLRREVRAAVHPVIELPLHTGSISFRLIVKSDFVILSPACTIKSADKKI